MLNNTLQDVMIRRARMQGYNACWIPGTDHASIATESKVVQSLEEKGIKKDSLSREEFLKHAWEWKEKYGDIIINQLKKLGCSCDWDRQRFTMDKNYSRAVITAFVNLYEEGLIYRGPRLVNWCPASKSAISDEEVIHKEKNGKLWYLRYSIKETDDHLIVATTRPETMLGDTAVAVNPKDDRYSQFIGEKAILPLVGREIPIIGDNHVDPEFGTGCIKVTPAHDPNDFAIGERHNLEFINIMNQDASMNSEVPKKYQKLTRELARKAVISDMESEGKIDKIEAYTNNITQFEGNTDDITERINNIVHPEPGLTKECGLGNELNDWDNPDTGVCAYPNTIIETKAIIILLVHAAKFIAIVISPAVNGAYKISTIFP